MLIINMRKFPGEWKVFNEKNPSFKSTLEDNGREKEEKSNSLCHVDIYVKVKEMCCLAL